MKTALTVWEDRISPVFDSADTLLVAEIQKNKVISKQYESFDVKKPYFLVEMLLKQDVSVFICGAISAYPAKIIETGEIELISFISGNTDKILDVFASGISIVPGFLMPGCKRGMCRYRKNRNDVGFGVRRRLQGRYSPEK